MPAPEFVAASAVVAAFVVLVIRGGRLRCTCKWAEFEIETDRRKPRPRSGNTRRKVSRQIKSGDNARDSPVSEER